MYEMFCNSKTKNKKNRNSQKTKTILYTKNMTRLLFSVTQGLSEGMSGFEGQVKIF